MRKQQQNRVASLMIKGFSRSEATVLKTIPFKAPYMQDIIKDRFRLLKRATKEGWSENKFRKAIALQYTVRGHKDAGQKITSAVVYRMIKEYQARMTPDEKSTWVSPSAKQSHHADFINRDKINAQKREYNARPEVKAKRAAYRKEHSQEIRNSERQRRAEKRSRTVGN